MNTMTLLFSQPSCFQAVLSESLVFSGHSMASTCSEVAGEASAWSVLALLPTSIGTGLV